MPVQKGDTVFVPADYLGGTQGRKVTIKWSQKSNDRSEDYWLSKFTMKSPNKTSTEEGVIYVQASKLEELKAKKIDGDALTFVVDNTFQYGQQKDGSHRFLVYHDKNNKQYQHRFIDNTISGLGTKAADFVSVMGFTDVKKVEEITKHFVGDYLKDF